MLMAKAAATPTEVRKVVDDKLATFAADVAAKQAAYFAAHGRYFQGIDTHPTKPADGAESAPDKTRKPTDQAEDWTAAGIALPATLPCGLRIDIYSGPLGHGYTVTTEVVIGGKTEHRTTNHGPETYRDSAWKQREAGPK